MKTALLAPLLATLAALASPAHAQSQNGLDNRASCNLRIEGAPTSWVIKGYDPFESPDPVATYDLTFINDGGSECVVYPTIELSSDLFGLASAGIVGVANRLDYSVEEIFSGVDLTPKAGRTVARANRKPVTIAPGQQELARFRVAVDDTRLSMDGLYSQMVNFVAVDPRGVAIAQRSIVIGLDVTPSAVMNLSGAFRRDGARAVVDLGDLTPGLSPLPLQVQIRSTRAYQVDFKSENKGRLVLTGTDWSIPYSLIVGETSLNLSSGGRVTQMPSTGLLESGVLPVRFFIGETSGRRAGQYRDIITITVSVN